MQKLIVILVWLSLFCSMTSFADEIKVQGGGTAIATVFVPIKDRFEKMHGDSLSIVESSAVKALIALSEGKVDLAAAAHPLEDLLAGAAKEGVIIDKSLLVATQVEENRLVVISNRANPVTALSKAELKALFTGRISNWKQVGGQDLPVNVVWGEETQGQNMQFTRVILDGEPVTSKISQATNYRSIGKMVSELPGGIGVIPQEINTSVTRSIDTVQITSPIYVITRGNPSEKVLQIMDFYKQEFSFLN